MATRQPKDFKVSRAKGDPITFTIGGDKKNVFKFTPPKQGPMLLSMLDDNEDGLGAVRGTMAWIKAGLSEEQFDLLMERLRDPEDDFDFDSPGGFNDVSNWLVEEASGRPTS